MRVLVEEIYEQARFHLNDVRVDGGDLFPNDRLYPALQDAFTNITTLMVKHQVPLAEKQARVMVNPYTTVFHPRLYAIEDMGEVVSIEERFAPSVRVVTGATATDPIQLTVDTTGFTNNMKVNVMGVKGQTGANGVFFIQVDSPTTLTLKGSMSMGAYTSGGVLCVDGGPFTPMEEVDQIDMTQNPESLLRKFENAGSHLKFIGSTASVQLLITYYSSGVCPTSGDIGIDDSLNYFARKTASVAGMAEPRTAGRAVILAAEAKNDEKELIANMVRDLQGVPRQPEMFGMTAARYY